MKNFFQNSEKKCVGLGGALSRTSLLLAFTIGRKEESSVSMPMTRTTQRFILYNTFIGKSCKCHS